MRRGGIFWGWGDKRVEDMNCGDTEKQIRLKEKERRGMNLQENRDWVEEKGNRGLNMGRIGMRELYSTDQAKEDWVCGSKKKGIGLGEIQKTGFEVDEIMHRDEKKNFGGEYFL